MEGVAVAEIAKAAKHEASLLPSQAEAYALQVVAQLSDVRKKVKQISIRENDFGQDFAAHDGSGVSLALSEISSTLDKKHTGTVGQVFSHLPRFKVEHRDAADRGGWDITHVLSVLELTIQRVKVTTMPDGRVLYLFFIREFVLHISRWIPKNALRILNSPPRRLQQEPVELHMLQPLI